MYLNEMNHKRSHFLKWSIIIGSLFMLLLLLIVAYLYYSVMQEKTKGYDAAEERARSESSIEQIDSVERYHGDDPYFVLSGTDEANNQLFVYVPFNDEHDVTTIEQPTSMTKEVIEDNWRKQCTDCQLTAIIPGILEDTAVWEIKYKVDKDTFGYEYRTMDDGTVFEQIQFTRHYK